MTLQTHAAAPGLPAARLFAIRDCLTLALDATESATGYTQHLRAALRQVVRLTGGAQ